MNAYDFAVQNQVKFIEIIEQYKVRNILSDQIIALQKERIAELEGTVDVMRQVIDILELLTDTQKRIIETYKQQSVMPYGGPCALILRN